MTTDKQLHVIFQICPEVFYKMASLPDPGPCTMASVAVKALARTMDGLMVPLDPEQPLTVEESQFWEDPSVYNRVVTEMALIQQEHGMRAIQGVIIFANRKLDPQTPPWNRIVRVVYLDEYLRDLEAREPDHPIVALFKPVFTKDETELERDAAIHYHHLRESEFSPDKRDVLCEVFVDWIVQRFRSKTRKEIEMLLELPDLRDTQCAKEFLEEGEARGLQKAVIAVATERIGTISASAETAIRGLTTEAANRLLRAVSRMNTLEELDRWLKSSAAKG